MNLGINIIVFPIIQSERDEERRSKLDTIIENSRQNLEKIKFSLER